MTGHDTDYDVIVVGYGPVGQTLAALLGKRGIRVAVVERFPTLYGLARAGHVDHEIMRIFQSIGAADTISEDAFVADQYVFQNAAGQVLMSFEYGADGVSGWGNDYIVYQPSVEDALDAAVRTCPSVDVFLGREMVGFRQADDSVTVESVAVTMDATGVPQQAADPRTFRARYLVAADGANSRIRSACGIGWLDLGFASTWLVVDLVPTGPMSFEYDNTQVCDPARPHCLFQLGKRHRRFEFAALPGEDPRQLNESSTAWQLMARYGVTPDNARIERQAVYTFGSSVADRVRDGRVFLVGDAAHLMPPFLGQGMCTGLRDAISLSWRLDAVLRQSADPALLGSFETERLLYAEALVQMSVAAGQVSCTFDPELAAARDEAMLSGTAPPPPPLPPVTGGLFSDGDPLAGELAPQGRVVHGTVTGRFDDVFGTGWTVLTRTPPDPSDNPVRALLATIDARIVHVSDDMDIDAVYRDFFSEHLITALVYRPDFRIWGTAQTAGDVEALIRRLASQLAPLTTPPPPVTVGTVR